MKKILYLIIAIIALSACQEKKMDRFEREAREFTEKNCPQHLDNVTTLDSMVFVNSGEGELRMYYTLQLDDDMKQLFMNSLGDLADENLSVVKNSVLFIKYKDAGVTFSYIYLDAVTGDKLVEYNFAKNQYQD